MNEPIFILSNPRTGSTLLRMLFDTHPDICSPPEVSLAAAYDRLLAVVEGTLAQTIADSAAASRRNYAVRETRRTIDGIMSRYCEAKGKARWCEKTPGNLEYLPTLRAVFPDAKLVCLHRHCLDAVQSAIEFYGPTPWQLADYLTRCDGDLLSAWIARWCDKTDTLLALEADPDAAAYRLRYEDLVADPDATLEPLFRFVGARWVDGLAAKVFVTPHDLGHGDPKTAASTAVARDRVGKGRRLDTSGVAPRLLERMHGLLARLDYDAAPIAESGGASAAPATAICDVAQLFAGRFPRQLARHGSRLAASTTAVGVVVTGDGGGSWTIHVDPAGARLEPGNHAAVALRCASADLLAAANHRLTLPEFRGRVGVEGDASLLDRPLCDRLMWTLFADDALQQT